MKSHNRGACAALLLFHAPNTISEQPTSYVINKGLSAAIADEITKFTGGLNNRVDREDAFANHSIRGRAPSGDEDTDPGNGKKKKKENKEKKENKKKKKKKASASGFGTALFSEICSNSPTGNVLVSPLSLHEALTLVKEGATIGSNNEAELDRALGPPSPIERTEEGADGDSGVQLNVASSIWAKGLKQSYIDGAMGNQSADAFPMPTHYTDVDEWITDKTNGMIDGFLGDGAIDPLVVALLVNAVYFKGAWTHAFDPEKTVGGEFAMRDGSKFPARYMTDTREVLFNEYVYGLGGASMVLLDYGKESSGPTEFTSIFILPESSDADSMSAVISGLNSQPISNLMENTGKTKVELELPRFRVEYGPAQLKSSLQSMGIHDAFDKRTSHKFDGMSNDPLLFVDGVFHGAVIEVVEEGTEAAGTTVVPIRTRSLPRRVTFDRPFVVAVVHRMTGTPVFIGRVEEPDLFP